jgi:arylamine N-acetyltransferase
VAGAIPGRRGSTSLTPVKDGKTGPVSATPASVSGDWVRRYLDLLGVEPPSTPSLSALAVLTRAHVLGIPFENVTSLLRSRAHRGRPVPPIDPDELLAGWEQGKGGGVCFEAGELFGRLLGALGYCVGSAMGLISFPGSHQALVVDLAGSRYLVDVANGAPFLEPIPLDRTVEVRRAGLTYRFRPGAFAAEWVQDRLIQGAWAPYCRYSLRAPTHAEREAAYQRHHTPGESWVTGTLTLIRCEERQVFVLRDEELARYTEGGKSTEQVSGLGRYAELAREVFRLPALPVADGVAAWRENATASRR